MLDALTFLGRMPKLHRGDGVAKAVRIEPEVWGDTRFKFLGEFSGVDRFSAIARLALVWSHCTERKTYNLFPEEIDAIAELQGFASHLLHSLILLGEKLDDGRIHLIGTKGRIEWYAKLEKAARKGGQKRSREAKRNKDGSFRSKKSSSPSPATIQPSPGSGLPAQPSVLVPAPVPALVIKNTGEGEKFESPDTMQGSLPIPTESAQPNFPVVQSKERPKYLAKVDEAIALWCEKYKASRGIKYHVSSKDAGIVRNMARAMSLPSFEIIFAAYLGMDNPFYEREEYPLSLLQRDFQKIFAAAQSGSKDRAIESHLAKARELADDQK